MAPIDIDRDAARDAAQNELSKAIYPRPSLTDQFLAWLDRLLYRITADAASLPGGWVTVTVLVVLAIAVVLIVVRIARRAMRSSRTGSVDELFAGHLLSAAEHRAAAQRHAAQGDWTPAIQHRLRAVARQLEEDEVLGAAPGRTATELAVDAGRTMPELASHFDSAAAAFNDVSYGGVDGTEERYEMVRALDDALGGRARAGSASETSSTQLPWAPVR
ncbi:MAG: DUF4129 domain-containing protein [Mycobacterium kyogaense]|uniref:DUF4129 domain-containing protein n=1 Tax=Mycobacterium kyogaense TaxID=2212479 RepID=UPI002FFA1DB9